MSTNTQGDVAVAEKQNLEEVHKYKVVVHNNDITSYDEVMFIITHVFSKSEEEAFAIARLVDTQGKGVCGVYYKEMAEAKLLTVQLAKDYLIREYPHRMTPISALKFTMEQE